MMFRRVAWLPIAAIAAVGCGSSSSPGAPDAPGVPGDGASPPAGNVTVKVFPDGVSSPGRVTANADLVAFQDGDGDWTQATGTGGVYAIPVASDRYAVAVGCRGAGTEIYYQSLAEAGTLAVNGCFEVKPIVDVAVSVTGLAPGASAPLVFIGDADVSTSVGAPTTARVEKGLEDIFIGFPSQFVYRAPAIDVEADQALTIDLSQALPPEVFPITLADPANATGQLSSTSSYLMPHTRGSQFIGFGPPFGASQTYATVPAAEREPGDVTEVVADEQTANPDGSLTLRAVRRHMTVPGPVTVTPAAAISAPSPVIVLDAVSQLSVTVPIRPSVLGHTVSSASFMTEANQFDFRYLHMFVRPGWAAGQATVTLQSPDLRNLASWTTDMELSAGTEVDWTVSVVDQDQPLDAAIGDLTALETQLVGKVTPMGQRIAVTACDARCRAKFVRRAP
jgi:hypothetical protein